MYHALAQDFHVLAVIQENRPSRKTLLQRRVKKLGLPKVSGQLLFMAYDRLYLHNRQQKKIDELIERYNLNTQAFPAAIVKTVNSVNDPDTIEALRRHRPDAVVISGTRIISADVLASISSPFLNIHAGITPRYRGVHGGYWALANGDRAHCGVTVHLVDTGIDTGAVLYQTAIDVANDDGFHTYPIHQIAKAIPLMKQALLDVAANRLQPGIGVGPSQLWSHPTLLEYIRNSVAAGVR
ncbi:formyl transferase [Allopusillimonas ginsengisoli]|nr:formyl transferase [Allopusillimonas ginsengisoli]